ncbi:MAG TPA: Gfo/Idh/MocA family oxidoreductase [Mycobacteriales bacterium]|nr:Gfo/Idh/MocA family oxidoreductase [Mycobacteriales bacterium]
MAASGDLPPAACRRRTGDRSPTTTLPDGTGPGPSRGGALMTQGAHAVDLLAWMLGDPVRVSAYSSHLAHQGIEVEDTIAATVEFAGGAIGTIGATTAAYPGMSVRLQLNGDAGTAVVDNEVLQFLHTRDAEPPDHPDKDNQAGRAAVPAGPSSVEAAHAAQYVDFIDAAEQGRPPAITTTDGRRVLALILAAYESARHNGRPVDIS